MSMKLGILRFAEVNLTMPTPTLISDSSTPLMVMATTGLFNNKDQSDGVLNIYKRDEDVFGNQSPWERLIERTDGTKRRPLIIVYDEGHNLSEQQTTLLAELEPDAYLLASATLKLPSSFNNTVIQHIKLWVDDARNEVDAFTVLKAVNETGQPEVKRFITTAVDSSKVVDAQLVKRTIQFDGTTAPMERCLDNLTTRLSILENEIDSRGLHFKPKAIYVCKTNITDDGEKDDHTKPFEHRKAPPIRIWRYLVEEKGINPKLIAIYANLTFADGNKPDEVNLFSKGENDFDDFTTGDYQHIIFNLSLQEGWDDPACYLAYIDKSMGSSIQVEQIIGRVLRQFGAKHYDNPLLNSAHFFLRVDNQSVFVDAIGAVKSKLQAEGAPIEIIDNFGNAGVDFEDLKPKEDVEAPLCYVNVDAEDSCERIAEILSEFTTFVEDSIDTIGQAHVTTQLIDLKALGSEVLSPNWTAEGHTNPVRIRWLISTSLRSRSNRALAVTDLKHEKFDVRVQIQSNASKSAEKVAKEIVEAYYNHAELVYENLHSFVFGILHVPKNAPAFLHGLYERYTGFNKFELPFAQALDKSGYTWHRNPSAGGFHIPLLSEGDTASFYPDFIVWKENMIFCLDTKGSHLLSDAIARKLFDIKDGNKTKIQVRFISEGKQSKLREKPIKGGYTVWKMKSGNPTPIFMDDLEKAVKECLK